MVPWSRRVEPYWDEEDSIQAEITRPNGDRSHGTLERFGLSQICGRRCPAQVEGQGMCAGTITHDVTGVLMVKRGDG